MSARTERMFNSKELNDMENKIEIMHLMVISRCDHNCRMCCNNLYDIDKIPVATVEELKTIHTLCITGGEPFYAYMNPDDIAYHIKKQYPNIKRVYVYTSGRTFAEQTNTQIYFIDGINIAPKDNRDWNALALFCMESKPDLICNIANLTSNRLYVFKEQVKLFEEKYKFIAEKLNLNVIYRKWDKVFKTPDNEIFRRLPILFV